MFHHLGYPSSLVNCIINKCDYSSTPDTETKSDEIKSQHSVQRSSLSEHSQKANARSQFKNRHSDVQPIYASKKLEQDLKLKEIKRRIANQHSVVYCFECDLCDSNYV